MIRTVLLSLLMLLSACFVFGRRTYIDNPRLSPTGIYLTELDSAPASFAIEARCAMPRNKVSHRAVSSWRIIWDYRDVSNYSYAEYAVDSRQYVDGIDSPEATVTLGHLDDGTDRTVAKTHLKSGQNFDLGYNSMAVEWRDGQVKIYTGANRLKLAVTAASDLPESTLCGLWSSDSLLISSLIVESEIPASRPLLTGWTPDALLSYLAASTDSIEGVWQHLDRTNDPAKARMGGSYTVATVWNPDTGVYDMIYMAGAVVNPRSWTPGMLKGQLRPTIFQDHFDLVWYDAMCKPVSRECNANMTQQAILELNFPLMDTRIRMSRVAAVSR